MPPIPQGTGVWDMNMENAADAVHDCADVLRTGSVPTDGCTKTLLAQGKTCPSSPSPAPPAIPGTRVIDSPLELDHIHADIDLNR
jgi:hypothetical protein